MPPSPVSSGNDSAGSPVKVHNEQNIGLPVAVALGRDTYARRRDNRVVFLEYFPDRGGVTPAASRAAR